MTFAEKVKAVRAKLMVSQDELAKLVGVSRVTVTRCLEWAKKMSHPTGIPLAEAHISETVAWIGYFSLIWCLLLRYNPSNCKQ